MSTTKQTLHSTVDCISHDILNRLTVINLCSSELRHSIAEKLEPHQLTEFKRLEDTVLEAAKMIQQLRASVKHHHKDPPKPRKWASALNRLRTGRSFTPLLRDLTLLR